MSMRSHIKNLRSCLTMISKHEKAIESSQDFAPRASYALSCFDIMVKHSRAFLICNLTYFVEQFNSSDDNDAQVKTG